MKQLKHEEMVEMYFNGNIFVFIKYIKGARKKTIFECLQYAEEIGAGKSIFNFMSRYFLTNR